jgi:hypothetical protein
MNWERLAVVRQHCRWPEVFGIEVFFGKQGVMTISKFVVVGVLLGLLAGCDKGVQPPVVFGAVVRPAVESVYLARELGYFQPERLQLLDYANAAEVKQAIQNNKVQFAALTLEEALSLRREVPDLKIILLFDAVAGSQAANAKLKLLDVLVARDESIGLYRREILQLFQGWRLAMDMLQREPEKSKQNMAKHSHMTPAQYDQAMQEVELLGLQRNQELLLGEPAPVAPSLDEAQRAMMRNGQLRVGGDASTLVDGTLLAGLKPLDVTKK